MINLVETNPYRGRDLSIFSNNMVLPRHRWYEFKEGFSEGLVSEAITSASKKARQLRVLDPFSGSGTTIVTAGKLGHEATGVEVNPFLAFAARAKSVPDGWDQADADATIADVLSRAKHETPSPLEGLSTFTESPGAKKWLFNRSVLRGFTSVDQALNESEPYHAALRLALFSSLLECSNAKRDGKCLRYRKGWETQGLTSADLLSVFERRARQVAEDIIGKPFASKGLTVKEGDAREQLGTLDASQFDLLVTSPPYLNSFDYSDIYRPELFAGGFVHSNAELRQLRLKTIRSHVQVGWTPSAEVVSPMLQPILEQLADRILWDHRLPSMVQSYFVDMAEILREGARLVRPGGQAWIVVSTSAYGGVEIPVDLILADIGTRQGWNLSGVYVLRQLRSAGQHWARLPLEHAT